jgi:hypothetical protein
MQKVQKMNDRDRRKLDDLQEGESRVKIDCGNTLCRGVYHGLVRMELSGKVRWYLDIRDARRKYETLVETSDVESLTVLRSLTR